MTNKHAIPQVPKQVVEEFLKQHHIKPTNVNRKAIRLAKSGSDSDDASDDEIESEQPDDDDSEMQGDDPDVGFDDDEEFERETIEEEEDNYFPTVERLYVFPKSKSTFVIISTHSTTSSYKNF